ncbi:hypothetical protein L5515_001205 [Caenorhabditis briggsae]|uniref:Uncharacterized protein n=1 Tax=Caenorhabditis briggsae TaxID=6238 RepID=A0AAE9J2K2_CAEBR|nr:hypothetical protein L5515_001205 [Caenorhabditis briggsae]
MEPNVEFYGIRWILQDRPSSHNSQDFEDGFQGRLQDWHYWIQDDRKRNGRGCLESGAIFNNYDDSFQRTDCHDSNQDHICSGTKVKDWQDSHKDDRSSGTKSKDSNVTGEEISSSRRDVRTL